MKNAALAVLLLSLAPGALAQPSERKGLLIGGSIGLGNSSPNQCFECETGLATELRLGAVIKPRLALLALWGSTSASNEILSERRGRHSGLIAAVQYWPSDRIWLRLGGGVAGVERDNPPIYEYSSTEAAGLAGIGFEINPRSKVVVELALQDLLSGSTPARYPGEPQQNSTVNTLMFTVGATFYNKR